MSGADDAIARVEVLVVSVPVEHPAGPAGATYRRRAGVIVRLEDASGVVGWGETYLRAGVAASMSECAPLLIGRRASQARALMSELAVGLADRYALSAVAIAVDDLRARAAGVRVADLYGGPRRTAVRAYASSGGYREDSDPEESWPEEVHAAVAQGFSACKIRIGRHPVGREMAILGRVREAVGSGVDLVVDANGAYPVPTARTVARELADLGFLWLEEPLIRFRDGLDYPGYELLEPLPIAIAGGEGLQTRSQFAAFIHRTPVTVLQPDVAICGGVGETVFVAELAALAGRCCVPHAWGGAIQIAATMQAISLIPDPAEVPSALGPMLEFDRFENLIRTDLCADAIAPVDGLVSLPDGPGLGITVDEPWLREHATVVSGGSR